MQQIKSRELRMQLNLLGWIEYPAGQNVHEFFYGKTYLNNLERPQ